MTCEHCGASISEYEERCPYCDSYIDHGPKPQSQPVYQSRPLFSAMGEDQVQPVFVILAFMIPVFGIIMGIIQITGGHPRSGRIYLFASVGAIALAVIGTVLLPLLFSFGVFMNMK